VAASVTGQHQNASCSTQAALSRGDRIASGTIISAK
jgi:hypothetical protein